VLSNFFEIVELLLQAATDPNHLSENNHPVFLAIENREMLGVVLKLGANVNATDAEGNTIVTIALKFQNVGLMHVIIFQFYS